MPGIPAARRMHGICAIFFGTLLLLFLLAAPGAAAANNTTMNTSANVSPVFTTNTPQTAVIPVITNQTSGQPTAQTGVVHRVPVISLVTPVITRANVTISGDVTPGTPGSSITAVQWDWGDGTNATGPLPGTHRYSNPGTFLIRVTAVQSDGLSASNATYVLISATTGPSPQNRTMAPATLTQAKTPKVTVSPPLLTPTTVPSPSAGAAPIITLREPEVSGLNVTIMGQVVPGSPGTVVAKIAVDWGDGLVSEVSALPVTHRYREGGSFTIRVVAFQSDGRYSTEEVYLAILTTPMPPPPGTTRRTLWADLLPLAILAVLIIGVVTAVVITVLKRGGWESGASISRAIRQKVDEYQVARERGDMGAARRSASQCAVLLRRLARARPHIRTRYLEKAEIWEAVARSAVQEKNEAVHLNRGVLHPERDTVALLDEDSDEFLAGTDIDPPVLEAVIRVSREIARDGREGSPVGTAFVIGDTDHVLEHSQQFVLNPFKGHDAADRNIKNPGTWENIKEFSLLDGAFVISGDGTVEAAGRYITVDTSRVRIPRGLGSRHASIAGITLATSSVGVVVSQSGGIITIFKDGTIVRTIRS